VRFIIVGGRMRGKSGMITDTPEQRKRKKCKEEVG
jgi:hypothetical protein